MGRKGPWGGGGVGGRGRGGERDEALMTDSTDAGLRKMKMELPGLYVCMFSICAF